MNLLVKFIQQKIQRLRLGKLPMPPESPEVNITRILRNPSNILIVPYNRLGAILLATRTFKAIRERYPYAKIMAAVHAAWSVLIQNDSSIDEVLTYGDEIQNPFSPEFRAAGEMLASRKFDLAFFLSYQYDLGPAYLTCLSKAALRVSFNTGNSHDFFNVHIIPSPDVRYEGERYLDLLEILGIPRILRDYTMTISDSIRDKVHMKFLSGESDTRSAAYIGFDLTKEIVGEPITRKQAENTIGALISDLDVTIILFFEPEKREIAAAVKESFGKKVIPVEDRPVSTAAGLMSFCSFVIARNTDLFQLAIALKIPAVAILSKNDMIQWSPGENDLLVHLERSNLSWPSTAIISQTARNMLKTHKQAEAKNSL